MLDIDIHYNRNIKMRNLIYEFHMNVKGINDGTNFSQNLLENIIEDVITKHVINLYELSEEIENENFNNFIESLQNVSSC